MPCSEPAQPWSQPQTCLAHLSGASSLRDIRQFQARVELQSAWLCVQVCHARIANVEVPNNKCIRYALQYIYGVGDTTAQKVLNAVNIDFTRRTYDLSEDEVSLIRDELENYMIEGDLRRTVNLNIKRCAFIGGSAAHIKPQIPVILCEVPCARCGRTSMLSELCPQSASLGDGNN
jgi:small subunit ribosomal protein S13